VRDMVFSLECVVKNVYNGFIIFGLEGFDDGGVFKRKAWVYGAFVAQGNEFTE
jgi:hypothetical protein